MAELYRIQRDPHAHKRPFVVVTQGGNALLQRKRGGGKMMRHFKTIEGAQKAIAKLGAP